MIDELPRGREMILVVDDHETIWDFLIEALQMLGYSVLLAENGLDAVTIYEENPGMIDLVLLDMIMPKAGGHETFMKLKSIDPDVKVMQALAVNGPESIDAAIEFAKFVDMLILDSPNPNVGCIGAAGVEHDRGIDRAIIEAVDIPVIIAGGLGPDNVVEAIMETHPWGVDSLTKTSRFFPDGTFEKDIELVRLFCERAHAVEV